MSDITDELLMAYADGELDSAEQRRVERYLANDPASAQRLEMFTQTGRDLGRLFDQPMREAIPERLLQTVMGSNSSSPAATMKLTQRRPRFLTALTEAFFPSHAGWKTAAATAALLIVGAAAGWTLNNTQASGSGPSLVSLADGALVASKELGRVLAGAPSGIAVGLGQQSANFAVKPVLSFQSISGGYCRQYELSNASGSRFSGVGCRMANGQWRIEVHSQVAAAPDATQGGITPASGRSSPVVESAIDRMIKGDALGSVAERSLIDNKWQASP